MIKDNSQKSNVPCEICNGSCPIQQECESCRGTGYKIDNHFIIIDEKNKIAMDCDTVK